MEKTKLYSTLKERNYDIDNMEQFEVDGIGYIFYRDSQELLLSYLGSEPIDELHIPAYLNVEGKDYPVIGNIELSFMNDQIKKVYLPKTFGEFFLPVANPGCYYVVDNENPCLMAVDGVLYSKDMSILYATPALGKGDFYVPETVSQIGRYAFRGSEEQSRVLIPSSVTHIEYDAFDDFMGEVLYDGKDGNCVIEDNVLYNKEKTVLMRILRPVEGDFSVPEGIEAIAGGAFQKAGIINKLTLPTSLDIENCNFFPSIQGVDEIEIAEGNQSMIKNGNAVYTKDMGELLRADGKLPERFALPEKVQTIAEIAFCGCESLKELTIPNSEIFFSSPSFSGCSNLTDIYCHAEYVPTCDDESNYCVIDGRSRSGCTLHVLKGMKEEYSHDDCWGLFENIVDDIEE